MTTPPYEVLASCPMTSPHVMQVRSPLVSVELAAMLRTREGASAPLENVEMKTVINAALRRIADFVNFA